MRTKTMMPTARAMHAGATLSGQARFPLRKVLPLLLAGCAGLAFANPQTPQVVNGQATFVNNGNVYTITNTPNTIINWQNFSVSAGEITRFVQQSADSAVLNRIIGQNPSQILGALQSNGRVFLINPNGILFGADSRVDVNGLVASSLQMSDQDFLAGKRRFTAGAGAGSVKNQGLITTPSGGQIYLIAPNVENTGILTSPKGDIVLAAGRSVDLVDSRDPELQVVVSAPDDRSINLGQIVAQGGRVGIYGALINQRGTVSANSAVLGENGKIVFKASGAALLEAGSKTTATGQGTGGEIQILGERVGLTGDARVDAGGQLGGGTVLIGGDYHGNNAAVQNAKRAFVGADASIAADALASGNGGKIIVWSDEVTRAYGAMSARGGVNGGNGGFIEASGKQYLDYRARADLGAAKGKGGTLLLDPAAITLVGGTGDGDTDGSAAFQGGSTPGTVNFADVSVASSTIYQSELQGVASGTNIVLEATDSITASGTFGNLLTLANNSNLTLRTRNASTDGSGTRGINLTSSSDGANLEIKTQGTGTITMQTGTGSSPQTANISVGKLTTGGGAVSLAANGAVTAGAISTVSAAPASGGDVTVTSQGAATLAGVATGTGSGTLNVASNGGAIEQSGGQWAVYLATLNAGSGAVKLRALNIASNFSATGDGIELGFGTTLTTIGGTAALTGGSGALVFDSTFNVTGALSASAAGGMTQAGGAVTVGGASTLASTAGPITLNGTGNDFAGAVGATTTGNNGIILTDTNAILLGDINSGSTLTVTAGSGITQNHVLTVASGATFNGGLGGIDLSMANAFGNQVSANNSGINPISLAADGAIVLGGVSTQSSLTVNAAAMSQSNTGLQIGGISTFTIANAGSIVLGSNNNDFQDKVYVTNTGNNTVTVTNSSLGGKILRIGSVSSALGSVYLNGANVTLDGAVTASALQVVTPGTFTNNSTVTADNISLLVGRAALGNNGPQALNATGFVSIFGSSGRAIDLGSLTDVAVDTVELSNAEMATIHAATLAVSGQGSGNFTVSAPINTPSVTGLSTYASAGDFTINAASGITAAGDLLLRAKNLTGALYNNGALNAPNITLDAAKMALAGGTITAASKVMLDAGANTNGITIGGATSDTGSGLELANSELATITANLLQIGSKAVNGGRDGTGALTVAGPVNSGTVSGQLALQASGDITIAGNLNMTTRNVNIATSSGAILEGAGGKIKGGTVILNATAGIGTNATALLTEAASLTLINNNTGGGGTINVNNNNGASGSLILGEVAQSGVGNTGAILIENTGMMRVNESVTTGSGAITLIAHSPLNINGLVASSGGGAISLEAGSTGSVNDKLTITSPVTTSGQITLKAGDEIAGNGAVSGTPIRQPFLNGGQTPTLTNCIANPQLTGCSAILPSLTACIASPSTTGCSVVLPTVTACTATPSQSGCSVVLPGLNACIAAPGTAGCSAVLPTLSACQADSTIAGCSAVLPTLASCTANPGAAGCANILPSLATCVANPSAAGCSAVLPSLASCIGNPGLTGCASVLPSLAVCINNPNTAGCGAVLPSLAACIDNTGIAGCTAVLPSSSSCLANPAITGCAIVLAEVCSGNPLLPGCSAFLPTLATCLANPATSGCSAILPSLAACTANPSTAGCGAVLPSLVSCTANPALAGCAAILPALTTCIATPSAAGCSAVLPSIAACVVNPTAAGCSTVLPTLAVCTSNPAAPGCAAVLPTLAACASNPAAAGCSAVLPSIAVCTAAPATAGCAAVLPTLSACTANPTAAGCSAVLPTLAACTVNPAAAGCSAVLPTLAACTINPAATGCSAVLPTLAACTGNPAAAGCSAVLPSIAVCTTAPATAGCGAVLPTLSACTANPTAAGCSAVLPTLAACTTNPAGAGCSAVLPTLAACTTNPRAAGCAVVLPSLAACTTAPATAGCGAVLPTLATCTAAPATSGCSAVLPTLATCTAAPSTSGCGAVLPPLAACTVNPAATGCSAVLPTLAACTANPAAAGCSVVLPTLATCTSAPATSGCAAVLPTLAVCTGNPSAAGCSVVLPTIATCSATPTAAGCSAVLPSLAACTAAPSQAGCAVVLPSVNVCIANPAAAGCAVVLPPTQTQTADTEPLSQALNTTINVIATSTVSATPQIGTVTASLPVKPAAASGTAGTGGAAAADGGTSGAAGTGGTSGGSAGATAATSDEKKDDAKKDDKSAVVAKADNGVKKDDAVKKMYCN